MSSDRNCYVCKTAPTDYCTNCYQIAYCSDVCQNSDWQYHKESCLQQTVNVVDSLINLHNFDHILRKICSYLSGGDLHYFGCVKRGWRDVILKIRSSEIERRLWRTKLEEQWRNGEPGITKIAGYKCGISRIEVNGTEIFVEIFEKNEIDVYDVTTNRFKFSLRVAGGSTPVWDVHKYFLLLFDGKKIYMWDRHKHEEVDVDYTTHMKMGTHFMEGDEINDDFDLGFSKLTDLENDAPVIIKIFPDPPLQDNAVHPYDTRERAVVVVYGSCRLSRWTFNTPYDFSHEKFEFIRVATSYYLAYHFNVDSERFPSFLLRDTIVAQPSYEFGKPLENLSKVFVKGLECIEYCQLEYVVLGTGIYAVDAVYCFFESSTLLDGVVFEKEFKWEDEEDMDEHGYSYEGYLILKRTFATVCNEFEAIKMFVKRDFDRGGKGPGPYNTFDEWFKDQKEMIQEGDDPHQTTFLEVYAISNGRYQIQRMRRRMKIDGCVLNAAMNDQRMAISVQDASLFSYIHIYDAKEIITDSEFCRKYGINYVKNPVPIQSVNLGKFHVPGNILLAGINRLIWDESINVTDSETGVVDIAHEGSILKCANFWMA